MTTKLHQALLNAGFTYQSDKETNSFRFDLRGDINSWSLLCLNGYYSVLSEPNNPNSPRWYFSPINSDTPLLALQQAIKHLQAVVPHTTDISDIHNYLDGFTSVTHGTDKELMLLQAVESSSYSYNVYLMSDDDQYENTVNLYLTMGTDDVDCSVVLYDVARFHDSDSFTAALYQAFKDEPELSVLLPSESPAWLDHYFKSIYQVSRFEVAQQAKIK